MLIILICIVYTLSDFVYCYLVYCRTAWCAENQLKSKMGHVI